MKQYLIDELYRKRSQDPLHNFPPGYKQVGDFHGGVFDVNRRVSPWSTTAQNTESSVMLVGQDWSSDSHLSLPLEKNLITQKLGYDPRLKTNKNLKKLLFSTFGILFEDAYATNVFVFVKPGKMSSRIPSKLMNYSAVNYAIPEIRIVNPKIVICLGASTYNCLMKNSMKEIDFSDADTKKNTPYFSLGDIAFVHAPHPGSWGTLNAGGSEKVLEKWSSFRKIIET